MRTLEKNIIRKLRKIKPQENLQQMKSLKNGNYSKIETISIKNYRNRLKKKDPPKTLLRIYNRKIFNPTLKKQSLTNLKGKLQVRKFSKVNQMKKEKMIEIPFSW